MSTIEYKCDADASSAETATYAVSTNPPLVLCAHHAHAHGPGLLAQGYTLAKLRGTPVTVTEADVRSTRRFPAFWTEDQL